MVKRQTMIRERNTKRRWRERYPHKARAQNLITQLLAAGKISKPDKCLECGDGVGLEAHHEDYFKPTEIMWLCRKCHLRKHVEDFQLKKINRKYKSWIEKVNNLDPARIDLVLFKMGFFDLHEIIMETGVAAVTIKRLLDFREHDIIKATTFEKIEMGVNILWQNIKDKMKLEIYDLKQTIDFLNAVENDNGGSIVIKGGAPL